MPVTYRILPERGFILIRFHAVYGTSDGKAAITAVTADARYDRHQVHLIDLRDVTRFDATFADMQAMVRWKCNRFSDALDGSRSVIIAPGDIAFGMARMYQQIADGVLPMRIDVVRTHAEAHVMLHVDAALATSLNRDVDRLRAVGAG